MKTLLLFACLCFVLLPAPASAGILWVDNVTNRYYGASDGYAVRYGYSDTLPRYKTYRVFRGPVQQGYWVPPAPVDTVQDAPVDVNYTVGGSFMTQSAYGNVWVSGSGGHRSRREAKWTRKGVRNGWSP